MKTGIIGLGAGGYAKGIIEIVRQSNTLPLAGLFDPRRELWGKDVLGVPVLGDDVLLDRMLDSEVGYFFVGIGDGTDTRPRQYLFEWALARGLAPISAIHPRAIVSGEATLAAGVHVLAGAIIDAGAELGTNSTVHAGAIVEHDCRIGAHAQVGSGARLAPGVTVGDGAHIGAGVIVRENLHIGEHAVIAAGTVVVKDVAPFRRTP